MNKSTVFLSIILLIRMTSSMTAAEYVVALTGDDSNPGTREKPLQTLEAARDKIRSNPLKGEVPLTVYIRGGRYHLEKTFKLETEDSGNDDAPILYRSMPGERVYFDGGKVVPMSVCETVSKSDLLDRLLPDARGKVIEIDLKKMGLSQYGSIGPRGFGRDIIPGPVELFIDGKPLTVSRWPNPGEEPIPLGKVLAPGSSKRNGYKRTDFRNLPGIFKYETSRVERWLKAKDLHISGIFCMPWADDTIKIAEIDTKEGTFKTQDSHLYGFAKKKYTYWNAVNLIEEIDLPGEFSLDSESGKLFFYPPTGVDIGKSLLQVPVITESLIELKGASYIHIEGITFENSRGMGIHIDKGTSNIVRGCTVRLMGNQGISVTDGVKNIIKSCDVYYTGSGGVSISGGNRKKLIPAGNIVENCDIHQVNRWYRTYFPCVRLRGVGNIVRHNHLHHVPGQCIILSGNNHIIEYNEVNNAVSEMADMGAIYTGRNPSCLGHIMRYNFFHNIVNAIPGTPGVQAIFFDDDMLYTANVYGNVFYRTGNTGVIKFNGGGGASIHNNIAIECPRLVKGGHIGHVNRAINVMHNDRRGHGIPAKITEEVDIRKDPYKSRYPYLYDSYTNAFNYGTPSWNNLMVNPKRPEDLLDKSRNRISNNIQQFVNFNEMNFGLKKISPMHKHVAKGVYDRVAGIDHQDVPFKPIPFGKIGVYKDSFRDLLENEER
jgi:hypothetical protein